MFYDKRRGDIWWMLDTHHKPQDTRLIRGDRPVIVVSNDVGNQTSSTITVVPLSASPARIARGDGYCNNVLLLGYGQPSMALPGQVLSVDRSDLQCYVGRLTDTDMRRVDDALHKALGI